MKLSLLAALAASSTAKVYPVCAPGSDYSRHCIPESLVGAWEPRYDDKATIQVEILGRRGRIQTLDVPVGSDAYTEELYADLDMTCRKTALAFDEYCHQYKFTETTDGLENEVDVPKYADFRLDGSCERDQDAPAELQCMYQQCMFEYCLYRRDDWVEECEIAIDAGTAVTERPPWGEVYSFPRMKEALLAGDFADDTCVDYFNTLAEY